MYFKRMKRGLHNSSIEIKPRVLLAVALLMTPAMPLLPTLRQQD
jgi:hypothetical protein